MRTRTPWQWRPTYCPALTQGLSQAPCPTRSPRTLPSSRRADSIARRLFPPAASGAPMRGANALTHQDPATGYHLTTCLHGEQVGSGTRSCVQELQVDEHIAPRAGAQCCNPRCWPDFAPRWRRSLQTTTRATVSPPMSWAGGRGSLPCAGAKAQNSDPFRIIS